MQFTAEMIAGLLGGEVVGNKDATVATVSSIDGGKAGSLAYLTNPKYEQYIYTTEASIVLVDKTFEPKDEVKTTLVKVENVGQCVLNLLEMYNATRPRKTGISKLASIHEGAEVGENAYIGDFTVVESTAKLGDNVQIYPQCYIGDNVVIGDGTKLYPGVKIYEGCRVGKNCILHAGVVVGADGFGFAPKEDGTFAKIPQLGNVIIEDNVELGANTCVDRAKTDSTIVHSGVKLDNLIQVGHNVEIGSNTVMSAQVGIAGTTKIGSNCFVGGQVGFADHINIGNGCKIGSQSGIDKSVPDGEIRFGSPALAGIQYHRSFAVFKNLPDLASKVRDMEKRLTKIEEK